MRIKKTSQYIEGGAGLPSYFTTETDTGMKWIDGSTIYRKVVDYYPTSIIGAANTTTNISIPHNITNLGQVTNARCISETNNIIPAIASSTGTTLTAGNCITQVTSTNINFRIINDTWSSRHFYIILEYTKSS